MAVNWLEMAGMARNGWTWLEMVEQDGHGKILAENGWNWLEISVMAGHG